METTYTLDYFITRFEQITSNKWCTKIFRKAEGRCAFGHLGCLTSVEDTEESKALNSLLGTHSTMELFDVNDGKKQYCHLGTTPKERVVNYLKSLRDEKDN